ncbi:hypothetical protein PENARI_c043G05577 [Penicillium arizonense]|uniref:Uncharacterized protein n=1 Tax=Penicillium arizonense TaxID=1835702 RepID=A0A1F5L2N6_PENAI|nr:hypothetical protein PENARI_c043G05577 [Penicillium arizonense]OGE47462.1 hypothetical protein PENARI_c043G05577 [Penicillium arizonense]
MFRSLTPTRRLMSIFYVTAIGTLGLSICFWANEIQRGHSGSLLLTAPAQVYPLYPSLLANHHDAPPSTVEFFSLILGTFCIGAASAMASIISSEFVYLINNDGNPYGISASHNDYLSKLSWAATSIQLMVVIETTILILRHKIGYLMREETHSSLPGHQP